MEFLLVILIAVSLSMDAFSLSLAYGTLGISKKQMFTLAVTVGIFHFFMPLIGLFIGSKIFDFFQINSGTADILVCIILSIIGLEMIYETLKKDENLKIMKPIEVLFFAFAVSIDSFSIGLTLTNINNNYLFSALMFSLMSFIFTFLGLCLGNKIKMLVGKTATILGGTILIIIGISYIF